MPVQFAARARATLRCRRAAAMVEYALLAGLIAVVAITAITSIGTGTNIKFHAIATAL